MGTDDQWEGKGTRWDKQDSLVILPVCEHVYMCAHTLLLVHTHWGLD